MPKCPNCGQAAARTEDWACQWCGYPLLSGSYRKITKTFKQLKEESLPERKPLPGEETGPEPIVEAEAVVAAEVEPEPVLEAEPEPVVEAEAVLEAEPEPTPQPEAVPAAEPEPAPALIEVTAAELLSAYETDATAADAKFTNRILKVTGVVGRIEVKEIFDVHYITLTGAGGDTLENVRCVFDREHGPELNQLTGGQAVTVQGKYDGSIIDICIRDCILVR